MALALINNALENDPDEDSPLLPEGKYHLSYKCHFTRKIHMTEKIEICFRVTDQGPYFMKKVSRFFNVKHIGRLGKNGKFTCSKKSAAYRELSHLMIFNRADRIPMSQLKNIIVIGLVKSVTKDSKQKSIHPQAHYSVVAEITGKDS